MHKIQDLFRVAASGKEKALRRGLGFQDLGLGIEQFPVYVAIIGCRD